MLRIKVSNAVFIHTFGILAGDGQFENKIFSKHCASDRLDIQIHQKIKQPTVKSNHNRRHNKDQADNYKNK